MSKSICAVLGLFALTLVPHSWAVPNAVVGMCVAGTRFTTIQAAIDAADVGSTVRVCPGTYPEILTITKDINVRGISAGTANRVVITVPPSGVPQKESSGLWGLLASQVLVQNATVNLSYLNIDGEEFGRLCGRSEPGRCFVSGGRRKHDEFLLRGGTQLQYADQRAH